MLTEEPRPGEALPKDSPPKGSPPWRVRRRETILAAASGLFTRRPYAEVQMDEVAREAGVGKATLYRYFPSKEELYLETLDQAFARLVERFSQVTSAEIPASERLEQLVRTLFDTMVRQLPGLKLLGGDDSELAERGRRLLRRRSRQIAAALREVLEAGIRTGHFRPLDAEMTAALIIGMVRGGFMIAGEADGRLSRAVLDMVHVATRPAAAPIRSSDP